MNHGCITTNANQSVFQCNGNIPVHLQQKKFKVARTPTAGRVMLTMFWDGQGVLLPHFEKRGENVNSVSYYEVLLKLQNAINRKRSCQLARGVQVLLLHHDNARPHTAQATQERIQELQWELLEHLPHSPDLASSDFHVVC
jgi:histone-lysine N-methyltransferase SETMAR